MSRARYQIDMAEDGGVQVCSVVADGVTEAVVGAVMEGKLVLSDDGLHEVAVKHVESSVVFLFNIAKNTHANNGG